MLSIPLEILLLFVLLFCVAVSVLQIELKTGILTRQAFSCYRLPKRPQIGPKRPQKAPNSDLFLSNPRKGPFLGSILGI